MSRIVTPGAAGMERVLLFHPSGSSAEIYLNGAQVTSWKPATGEERLFLSEAAEFGEAKAIRGGIPVVFPQFADSGPLPKHGWLRTTSWGIDSTDEKASALVDSAERMGVRPLTTSVTLFTDDDRHTRQLWPHGYHAELTVTLDADSLRVELAITNTGAEAFELTAALHSYLAVHDVEGVEIRGLHGTPYIDKTAGRSIATDTSGSVRVAKETDRIYMDAPDTVELEEMKDGRRLEIKSGGFTDVIVWNPWRELAASLRDMRDDDYRRFVCVEAARAVVPLALTPGETFRGSQHLRALA